MRAGLVERFDELVDDGLLPELAVLQVGALADDAGANERREAWEGLGLDFADDLGPESRVGGGYVP